MANIIKIKRGFTAGYIPAGLTLGELAANIEDGKLFIGGLNFNNIELGAGGAAASSFNGDDITVNGGQFLKVNLDTGEEISPGDTGPFQLSLRPGYFNYAPDAPSNTTPPSLMCMADLVQSNEFRLLADRSCTAAIISDNTGRQVITQSTAPVILVDGYDENQFTFSAGITGVTGTAISFVYYNAADVTIFAYSGDQTSHSIRKFMILGNGVGLSGAKFTEYSNISTGTNLGSFSVEATGDGGYWGLVVTPGSSAQTYFDINAIKYRGHQILI